MKARYMTRLPIYVVLRTIKILNQEQPKKGWCGQGNAHARIDPKSNNYDKSLSHIHPRTRRVLWLIALYDGGVEPLSFEGSKKNSKNDVEY